MRARGGALLAVAVAGAVLLSPAASRAEGVVQTSYSLTADGTHTWTGDVKTATQKYTHTLDVKYRGFLRPVVENEFTMKVEWDQGDDAKGFVKVTPELTLKYKGSYWNSGVKRGIEESTEPGKTVKYQDKAFIEAVIAPPRATLPDFKLKYNVDKDYQAGQTDTTKHAVAVSSDYRPFEWLAIKGEWSRTLGYDHLKEDSDTEDEKYGFGVGVRRIVGRNIRLQSEYRIDDSRSATLLTGGGVSNPKRDQNHTWKNAAALKLTPEGTVEVNYDYELKQRMADPFDHDLKWTLKAVGEQKLKILGELSVRGEFNRVDTEVRHKVGGDTLKTEDTLTGEAKTKPTKFTDLTFKASWKRTTEETAGSGMPPASTSSFQRSVTWVTDLLPFWKPILSADRTDSWAWSLAEEREVPSVTTTVYSYSGPIILAVPVFEVAPAYTVTFTDDPLAETKQNTVVRDFTTKVTNTFLKTRRMEGKFDHTYARKVDTKAGNVVRTDTTNINVTAREFLPSWTFDAAVTRSATDTSGDDLGVDLTEGVTLKAELKRDPLKVSLSYKYDRTLTVGKYDKFTLESQTGWVTPDWDVNLTTNYKRTLSPLLDQGLTLSLTFNYKL